jgi:MFS family permease
MKSRLFWQITIGISLMFIAITAVTTHIMPYLGTIGIDRNSAGFIAGALPLTSLIGRIGAGWIGDRFSGKWIAVIGCIMVGLGLVAFTFISAIGNWIIVPFIIVFSIGWGGITAIMPILLRQYFGNTNLSTLYGFSVGVLILTSVIGPPLAAVFYDRYDDYQWSWFTMIAVSVVGIICVLTSSSSNKHLIEKPL